MASLNLFTVKLGTAGLTSPLLVERGRGHVVAMTLNPNYLAPTPPLADITTACDALEVANLAVQMNGGKVDYLVRNQRAKELRKLIKELAGYVQATSGGDPEKIASAAFQTCKVPEPVGEMQAPGNLRARITPMVGEIHLHWSSVRGHMIYILWWSIGDPLVETNWKQLTFESRNVHTVKGLDSGKAYSFRVVAVGAAGEGPASDPATAKPL